MQYRNYVNCPESTEKAPQLEEESIKADKVRSIARCNFCETFRGSGRLISRAHTYSSCFEKLASGGAVLRLQTKHAFSALQYRALSAPQPHMGHLETRCVPNLRDDGHPLESYIKVRPAPSGGTFS